LLLIIVLIFRLLFFSTTTPYGIYKASLNGAIVTKIVSTNVQTVWGLDIDICTNRIFWVDFGKYM